MGLWRDSDREPSQPGEVDAFCATLIESANVDRPSAGGLSRTARRLGVPLAAVGAAIGTDLIARSAAAAEGLGAAASGGIGAGGVGAGGVGAGGVGAAGSAALVDAVASSVGSAAAVAGAAGSAVGGGVSGTAAVGGAAVATGMSATGMVATGMSASATIGPGTVATAVGVGTAAASGWGASSALLLVAKAVGAGALAGAIGIGAVKVADRGFSENGWFGSSSVPAAQSESLARPDHALSPDRVTRPDVPGPSAVAVPGELTAPAVGARMNQGAAGIEEPGGGLGSAGLTHGSPSAQHALDGNPAVNEGVANALSTGRAVLESQSNPEVQGSLGLQGNSDLRDATRVPSGSLAMRGVGELPSASAGSFPEQTGGAAGSVARAPAVPPEAADAPSALRVELALLNRVRGLLQQGRGADGLRALDQYQTRFPSGSLGAEALLLRVEALALAGRREEALRAAERMVERFPRSPHRARLQELGLLPAR